MSTIDFFIPYLCVPHFFLQRAIKVRMITNCKSGGTAEGAVLMLFLKRPREISAQSALLYDSWLIFAFLLTLLQLLNDILR
jgi:hypothetical protein